MRSLDAATTTTMLRWSIDLTNVQTPLTEQMSTTPKDLTGRVQRYENHANPTAAIACPKRKFDIVQIKYDGWWARVVISDEVASIYSRQNQLKAKLPAPGVSDMVLLGEYLVGTNRSVSESSKTDVGGLLMVFDALELPGHKDWLLYRYDDRHDILRNCIAADPLPTWCRVVKNFIPEETIDVWNEDVIGGGARGGRWGFCGSYPMTNFTHW